MVSYDGIAIDRTLKGESRVKKAAKKIDRMDGAEFWTKLQKLGFSQVGFARAMGLGDRTVRRWCAGHDPVPLYIAMLINLMIKTKTNPEDLHA